MVLLEQLVAVAVREHKVELVVSVLKVVLVERVQLVRLEQLVAVAELVERVQLVRLEHKVLKVVPVVRVQLVRLEVVEHKEALAEQGVPEHKVVVDLKVLLVPQEQMVVLFGMTIRH
jgi:hypothetical protein